MISSFYNHQLKVESRLLMYALKQPDCVKIRGLSRSRLVENLRNENTSRSDATRREIRDEKPRQDLNYETPR